MSCPTDRVRALFFVSILTWFGSQSTFCLACADPVPKGKNGGGLTTEDQELLASLLKGILFDPKNAQRVRIKTRKRTVHASWATFDREGWLVKPEDGTGSRVFFTDRTSVLAPAEKNIEKIDFVSTCRARYTNVRGEANTPDELQRVRRERFGKMRRNAVGNMDEPDLALAAWLHRLGNNDLAALALERARESASREDKTVIGKLRSDLAWSAFADLVHAHMVRADQDALAAGERLLRDFPEEAEKEFSQAEAIVADLKRRQKEGSFGKRKSSALPKAFREWNTEKKTTHYISLLDEIDERQMSQPGEVSLIMNQHVMALVKLGDAAVPALIDTIEQDTRLTRSVHYWRDFSRHRVVLGVREAALEAILNILKVQFFESRSTGDNFTSHGDTAAKSMAAHLREYWREYGHLPFDERMMKVLTNPESRFRSAREAALNLAHLNERRFITTGGSRITFRPRIASPRKTPNPAVAKFENPSTAEAILAAMDRDLKNHDTQPHDQLYDYTRRRIEDQYLEPLIYLGDKRIAGKLKSRYQTAKTIRSRRKWANAAHHLGDPEAMQEFARDVEEGTLELPTNDRPNANVIDQPGNVELRGIIQDLSRTATPAANSALFAIADPKHPYFEIASQRVLNLSPHGPDSESWFSHAYCLKILRSELDNKGMTGGTYRIEGMRLIHEYNNGGKSSGSIPPLLADPKTRQSNADARHCDRAAEVLRGLVIGLPAYHPLQKDADEKLKALKHAFDSFRHGYRRVTPLEGEFLGVYADEPVFIPNMQPLGRPASEEDVKAGRAIFHLGGKGQLAKLRLPAVASPKTNNKALMNRFGGSTLLIIVQAEIDENGNTVYGVIGDGSGRVAKPEELTNIRPIKKSFSLFDLFK